METVIPDVAFQYQVTEPVFVSAYLTHYRRYNRFRAVMYYLYPIIGGILVLMAVLLAVLQSRAGEDWNGPVPLFLLGCLWLFCYLWRPFYFRRLFRKDQRFREPIRVSVTNGEMSVITATSEGKYKKGIFVRALESDDLILLYHSPVMFSFIPKRQLTADQLASFEVFLNDQLPVRKGANRFPELVSES
jgi:hypothetical protein